MQKTILQRGFYSRYFTRRSFLSFEKNDIFTNGRYLGSIGFTTDTDFTGKTVLELGAGCGRLTIPLYKMKILQKAKRYIVVEPSRGIEQIKHNFTNNIPGNIVFLQCDLEYLHKYVPYKTIDYFIASGVIPHIDMPLAEMMGEFKKFLTDDGLLHVVSSFHGFSKAIFRNLKNRLQGSSPFFKRCAALLQTMAQYFFLQPIMPSRIQGWYLRNFVIAASMGFIQKYRFFVEVLSVLPCNTWYSYKVYIKSAAQNDLFLTKWFHHSLAVLFGQGECNFNSLLKIPTPAELNRKSVFIYNKKSLYFSDAVWCELELRGIEPTSRVTLESIIKDETNIKRDSIVLLGYNYLDMPYYECYKMLINLGYKKIFHFQMFL